MTRLEARDVFVMHDVSDDVRKERFRQIERGYTPEHDDAHTASDFAHFIQARLGPNGPAAGAQAMLEIAALAHAALESLKRKETAT